MHSKLGSSEWTIPDTRITIERVEEGPRAGEFLFSADTVQRLDRLYRHAKHLPYKPGAAVGIYDEYVSNPRSPEAVERMIRNRLKSVDTSSPRSTFLGFLGSVNQAHALVMQADAALAATPPTMTGEQASQTEKMAHNLLQRAMSTLDLSRVPEALRPDLGIEAVLQLKEIFDRMQLPLLDRVPDARMVEAARERASRSSSRAVAPLQWRYPNTEIAIAEIMEGERQGEFLFSAATVRRLGGFYAEVRELPYRGDDPGSFVGEYEFPGKSEGFYDYYITTPGHLVPRAHFLGGLLNVFPAGSMAQYAGHTVWQWTGLVLSVVVISIATLLAFGAVKRLASRLTSVKNYWLRVLAPIVVAGIVTALSDFINDDLNMTGDVLAAVKAGGAAIVVVMMAWAVLALCKAIAETMIATPRVAEESIDASLLRVGAGVIGFLIAAWIVIDGARELGADVIPLVAGLGVGGLAVALAARTTIANFIGSLILFANRPVRVGDLCRYGDQIGTVERIGFLSTRIRSLERSIVTVPNAEFSEMKLDNLAARDQRRLQTLLRLRYETTPEQLRNVLDRLRHLLQSHPKVSPDPVRVRFVELGEYSLDVEIVAYLLCRDQETFLAIKEELLLRVVDVVKEAGADFALPSRTAFLGRDRGLDTEHGAHDRTEGHP